MLVINGRIFMNIQEAVQWLLENNALPFICKADYAADTIIAKSEIVNPSPAELKVGAVVYFHDCIIAVVTGITSNGFQVGSDHIDMREGLFDGNIHIAEDLSVDGDTTIGGDLNVERDAKIFEDIVDKDGHKRFIEGDITIETLSGVTQTYGKWSLSGTHLMIVVALTIASGSSLPDETNIATLDLPQWVKDKLQPLIANYVSFKTDVGENSNWSPVNVSTALQKDINYIHIRKVGGTVTATADTYLRIQYDFLIDNE